MKRSKFFLPLLFLLMVLAGCFSTEKKEVPKPVTVSSSGIDSAPTAQTPDEALRQLLEGNSRVVHQEARWVSSSSLKGKAEPFALVINAGAGEVRPEEVFDLPKGSVPMLLWNQEKTDWKALAVCFQPNIKTVVVLLPYRSADWPDVLTGAITSNTKLARSLYDITRQLQGGCPALSRAIAQGNCRLLGAMLYPETQRLICLPFFK